MSRQERNPAGFFHGGGRKLPGGGRVQQGVPSRCISAGAGYNPRPTHGTPGGRTPPATKDGAMKDFLKGGLLCCAGALVLLMLGSGPALAQEYSARDWNRQGDTMEGALGLHWGKLGGNGLSFRYPLRWYLYLQGAGGIWHSEDDQKHNLGLQLNYILRQDSQVRLYLGLGLGYFYHRERVAVTDEGREVWDKDRNWNTGAGVGMEYLLGPRLAIQGELDFVHESSNENIKVSPQVGLHYYW